MINVTGKIARQKEAAKLTRQQIRFEWMLIRRIVPLIDRQARAAAKIFRETGSEADAELAISGFGGQLKKLLTRHYKKTGIFFGNEFFRALNGKNSKFTIVGGHQTQYVDHHTHDIIEYKDEQSIFLDSLFRWISSVGADRVVKIQETTKNLLRTAIQAGREAGEGQDAIAKRIFGKISGVGRLTAQARARTIARTETHNAQTYASDMAAESTGLTLIREWLANEDKRTRPTHGLQFPAGADGQKVSMNEPFDVGGFKLMRPGDTTGPAEETINCRCGLLYHTVN
jgi:hypothetical protein